MDNKPVEEFEEELGILKQIRKWSRDDSLDIAFCEILDESLKLITGAFEGIIIKTPVIQTVVDWDCPACDTGNEYKCHHEEISWMDTCKECRLDVRLEPLY